jgi:hypothetical protein
MKTLTGKRKRKSDDTDSLLTILNFGALDEKLYDFKVIVK